MVTTNEIIDLNELVNKENHESICIAQSFLLQRIAIENAIKSLNELNYILIGEYTNFGHKGGFNIETLEECNKLQGTLINCVKNRKF